MAASSLDINNEDRLQNNQRMYARDPAGAHSGLSFPQSRKQTPRISMTAGFPGPMITITIFRFPRLWGQT